MVLRIFSKSFLPRLSIYDRSEPVCQVLVKKNAEITRWLITKGLVGINEKDKDGHTPLWWAIHRHDGGIATRLIEQGANVHERDQKGRTVLWKAMLHKDTKIILELLMKNGADINAKDKDGQTPLCWAIYKKNTKVAKRLIKQGANIDEKDENGRTPLWWAINRNEKEIANRLIDKGANIHEKDENGHTPLWWAVDRNEEETINRLIKKGANIHEKDVNGRMLLCWAISRSKRHIVKLLIESGSDLHAKNPDGYTVLWWALYSGYPEILELLVEYGANIHEKDKEGWTLLHYTKVDFFGKEIIRAYSKHCLINKVELKRPNDLPSDLSHFWDECQSQVKEIIEKNPYFIRLIVLEDRNELVTAISGVCRENKERLDQLKSLSHSQAFIHAFGTRLQEGLNRYEILNDCLIMSPRAQSKTPIPFELWDAILRRLSLDDLQNVQIAFKQVSDSKADPQKSHLMMRGLMMSL